MIKKHDYIFDAAKLRETLEVLQLSSADVARMLGRTERTLFNHRTGRTSLTIRDYLTLTNKLGLDPTKFFATKEPAELQGAAS